MLIKRHFRRLVVAALPVMMLAGVINPANAEVKPQASGLNSARSSVVTQASGKKVLHYNINGEPDTLDPQQANYTDSIQIGMALFRGLLRIDEKSNVAPSIAKEVPSVANGGISADGTVYTFKLNDWKWSDGKGTVTAGDFVYTWQRLVDPALANPYAPFFNGVIKNAQEISDGKMKPTDLGVKAVDDKTFQVTLAQPKSFFLALTTLGMTYVVRKDVVEKPGLSTPSAWTDPANGTVVGTGPFIITKWDHQNEIVLEKNPNFSGTAAKLDEVDLDETTDQSVTYAAYKNNELDITTFPAVELHNIEKDPVLSKELHKTAQLCTWALAMDYSDKPFSDKNVRLAFAHALDRDSLISTVNQGLGFKTYSWLPPGIFGYDANAGKDLEFDVNVAKKYMSDAGFPDGKGFPAVNFNYRATPNGQRRAEWFQAQLEKNLSITINLNPMETAAYEAATSDPKVKIPGIEQYGWCTDYPHPQDWFTVIWVNGTNGNGNNITGYNNADFEKASLAADAEVDQAKALVAYQALQKQFLSDVPIVPLYNDESVALIKPHVKGIVDTPLDGGFNGTWFWENIDIQG